MKVLVTGHKGYIGSKIYDELIRQGFETTGIDLKEGDDILHCLPRESYDYVFHLSAYPKVSYSIENPSYTLKQNVLATSVLLEWSVLNKVKRVIFSSSAAVNDGEPKSPYGLHKLMNELECKLYSDLYGLDTVCLRYYNVYSENQEFGGAYSTAISAWMEMIKQNKPLRIDGDGNQTRDFIHLSDIVSANIFCMKNDKKFNGKVLNVGTGKPITLNYIKKFINHHHNVIWKKQPERIGDIRHSCADISDLKDLGWQPKISIDEGLNKCFKKEKT
mgnify:CR=1 FL=1